MKKVKDFILSPWGFVSRDEGKAWCIIAAFRAGSLALGSSSQGSSQNGQRSSAPSMDKGIVHMKNVIANF
jgi:hypothetical protein